MTCKIAVCRQYCSPIAAVVSCLWDLVRGRSSSRRSQVGRNASALPSHVAASRGTIVNAVWSAFVMMVDACAPSPRPAAERTVVSTST